MADHRIIRKKERLDFTCENRGFMTNITKGYAHGKGNPAGSVFKEPLAGDVSAYSLWLEHVISLDDESECFWLMWYDKGQSTIPASGVLSKKDIATIGQKLVDLAL